MATIGQAARARENRRFAGRERELEAFRAWLSADEPAILNISGPGGLGKTALLGAFERAAGRPVVHVDGRTVLPTREAFLSALGQPTIEAAVAHLSRGAPLLMIDTFEALAGLTRFLREELIPRLDSRVRLVIAGRHPLGAWLTGDRWPVPIRSFPLDRLNAAQSRAYLESRGIDDPELITQILASCGGWPLALSLAADLVEQFDLRRLPAAPEWHLAVRGLVEHLLDEAADPRLRTLLEACSVVRRFDEETLTALTGEPAGGAFAALCRLSIVRPTERGLALHDDVRRLVADDLRWRRPERHAELRLRALGHLRERASRAEPHERERLLEERLFHWGHEVVRTLLYAEQDGGEVWVEPARPQDLDELTALHRRWQTEVRVALGLAAPDASWDADRHWEWFGELVSHPAARVHVARDRVGQAVGYDVVLPMCAATLPLASRHDVIGAAVDAWLATPGAGALPEAPADVIFLAHLGLSGHLPEATRAALIRDLLSVLARGGVCLCALDMPEYRQLAEALGFRPIPGSEAMFRESEYVGYVLDLRRIGAEAWIQSLLAGGPRPPVGPGELERALRDVLVSWHDDDRVAGSALAVLTPSPGAEAVRSMVEAALDRAAANCGPEQGLALRAVRLAYLERMGSHERAADALHVSRSTFYRLLHRGVALVADALPKVVETPPILR
jgi:hypothetical protein